MSTKAKLLSSALLGQTLTMTVSQGKKSFGPVTQANYGITTSSRDGSGDGGALTITLDRTRIQCAPDSVRFGVDLSRASFDTPGPGPGEVYDPRLHELIFLWNTGDTGTWSAPQNVLPEWNDKSRAKGPWFAHCYTTPRPASLGAGNGYQVQLTVIEPSSGKIATASTEIFVEDPDTVYSGTKTVCINSTGYAGANDWGPSGAAYVDWDDAQELAHNQGWWGTYNTSSDRRFLFDPNQTYTGAIGFLLDGNTAFTNPYIGSLGSGRVTLTSATTNTSGSMVYVSNNYDSGGSLTDLRIVGIEGSGGFDPVLYIPGDAGASGTASNFLRCLKYFNLIVSDSRISGFRNSTFSLYPQGSTPNYTHIDDTLITSFGGTYAFISTKDMDAKNDSSLTISGGGFVQDGDAIDGGGTFDAPVRDNGHHKFNLRCAEMFGQDNDNSGWKLCTSPHNEIGHIYNLDGVYAEGTQKTVHIQQNVNQGATGSMAMNFIMDGAIVLASCQTVHPIHNLASGVTIRNAIVIIPDSPSFANIYFDTPGTNMDDEEASGTVAYTFRTAREAINNQGSGTPTTEGLHAPIEIYNCTFRLDRLQANNNGRSPDTAITTSTFTGVVAENNIKVGEWSDAGSDGPLSTTALFTPYHLGFRGYATKTLYTEFATTPTAIKESKPQAGSAAIGDATTGLTAYHDITGKKRLATVMNGLGRTDVSRGAWEVALDS